MNCLIIFYQTVMVWGNDMSIILKGHITDVNYYRGVSLLCTMSNIFIKIVNNYRHLEWIEKTHKMFEEQPGFTENNAATDNIFGLMSAVQKYLR